MSRAGTGGGTVTSAPSGIECGAICTATVAGGTSVTLSAVAAAGSSFAGWSGACSGVATSVAVTVNAAAACAATFNLLPAAMHPLTVSRTGIGTGAVSSQPSGIDCGAACTASFAANTSVTLTAVATAGSNFAGWSGACSGAGARVSVTVTAATACGATFDLAPIVGSGTSGECEDPLAETPGRRTVRRYTVAGSQQLEYVQTVVGPATVGGESATEFLERSTYLAGPAAGQVSDVTTFSRADPDAFRTFAVRSSTQVGALTTTMDYVLDPYQAFPRSLTPGQAFTHSYSRRATINGGTPVTTALVDSYRFLGFSDVTVPAGSFTRACRWSVTQQGVTTNMWLARGSGIVLKVDSAMELVSAQVDGIPVLP
ncbi:MAG: hypothetical protein JNJ89_18570 [Rubrivivax sp.]|nr:hypothetical protein [Rubrivivax sp.]